MKSPAILLLAAAAALLGAPGAALAQAKVGDRFGDWVFECVALAEGRTACALTSSIASRAGNQRLVQFSLGRNEARGGVVLTAFLPLGIHLPSGVSGAIDQGKPFQYVLETCLPRQGCIATHPVSAEFLKALQGGKQLSISVAFAAAGGPRPVSGSAALSGLAEGLKAAKLN